MNILQADGADLDDLDATALEDELVEPDDFDQSQPYNPPQVNPPPASAPVDGANANANAGGPSQPAYSGAGNAFGNAPANKAEDNNEGADRIRPSDMPDEGLVVLPPSHPHRLRNERSGEYSHDSDIAVIATYHFPRARVIDRKSRQRERVLIPYFLSLCYWNQLQTPQTKTSHYCRYVNTSILPRLPLPMFGCTPVSPHPSPPLPLSLSIIPSCL